MTEVTQLKTMQQALQESEARLAAFMENAPVGMYLKDLEGRYVLLNPEMSKVLDTDVESMLGRTVLESPIGPYADFIPERDQEVLRTGRVLVTEEHLPNPDEYTWELVIRFPVRDADGRIIHIGGFDVDITARKAMEEALKASEQRFRAFAEAHPVPLFISESKPARSSLPARRARSSCGCRLASWSRARPCGSLPTWKTARGSLSSSGAMAFSTASRSACAAPTAPSSGRRSPRG